MFVVFYIVNLDICELFSFNCLYDTLMGPWNVFIYECMYVCMHVNIYECMYVDSTGSYFPDDKLFTSEFHPHAHTRLHGRTV